MSFEDNIIRDAFAAPRLYFCHMDIKEAPDRDWTEGETVKTLSIERARKNMQEVKELRQKKGLQVKNLKLYSLQVSLEEEEEEE